MEICYLSFWIKTNMQSMQMHKLQINKKQTRKLTIQNLHQGCMEAAISELLPLPA